MPPVPTPEAGPKSAIATAPEWQKDLIEAFRNPRALLEFLALDPAAAPRTLDLDPRFPLRVPRAYAALMRPGDWNDPLLRQTLALDSENVAAPGFTADAVGDHAAQDGPAVLRKYAGRALLVLTGQCAVHCRYCFRREYPYEDQTLTQAQWDAVYARLGEDPDVEELIFSGGDPLSLSDAKLR